MQRLHVRRTPVTKLLLFIYALSGIDVVAISSHPGHLLVFDCEGGNNAMSKSHSIVTVARASTRTTLSKKGKAGKYKHEAAWVVEPYGFLACS